MARKRRGQPVHGWLIIDKPLGLGSTQVVGRVRYLMDAQKAGHGGTLDPLASGILPIALGEATKTVSYAMDGTKVYEFTARWGQSTTTDDLEGDVVESSDKRPGKQDIVDILHEFEGEIDQVPPIYSAIKIDGKRAYDLARADQPVTMPSRKVNIHTLTLLDASDPDQASFRVCCGKGTYIRSLARDLAIRLGTVAHVIRLRRTAVGPFTEKHAISLDSLEALGHSARDSKALLGIEAVLDDIPALALTTEQARRLKHGQVIHMTDVVGQSSFKDINQEQVFCAMAEGQLIALAKCIEGELKPFRVLNR
ncbi:MAG: tRNA pseudouridine(55) synthase TruB [Rhodospirillales bacterium]|nr:tRNA pseudouridine(55) synthase TruB [Rhodospirillales bacterium]